MAKKGVFGMKETPLDSIRGKAEKPKPRPKSVTIRAVNNGYIVACSPDTHEEYQDKETVKETLDGALEAAKEHLEGKKEKKD